MFEKILFLFLLVGASERKESVQSDNIFISLKFVFKFLDYPDLFHVLATNKTVLKMLLQYLARNRFDKTVDAFEIQMREFLLLDGSAKWSQVDGLELILFVKLKCLKPLCFTASEINSHLVRRKNCFLLEIDPTSIFNLIIPISIPILENFTFMGELFTLLKFSSANAQEILYRAGRKTGWSHRFKNGLEVYVKYVSETDKNLSITYSCEKGSPNYVIDDAEIQYFSNLLDISGKPIFGRCNSVDDIPNVSNKSYLTNKLKRNRMMQSNSSGLEWSRKKEQN